MSTDAWLMFAVDLSNVPRWKIANLIGQKYQGAAQSDPPPNRNAIFGHFAPGYPRNLNTHRPAVQIIDWAPWDPQSLKISRKSPRPFSRYWGSKIFLKAPPLKNQGAQLPNFYILESDPCRLCCGKISWKSHRPNMVLQDLVHCERNVSMSGKSDSES